MFAKIYRELEDGATLAALGYDILIKRRSAGQIHLPTGQVVACDPLTHPETEPFDFEVPPGTYPVRLCIADMRDEIVVAYAIIEIAPEPASRWKIATVPSEDTSLWSRDEYGFTGVSSLGGFMDAQTAARLIEYNALVGPDEDNEVERSMESTIRRAQKRDHAWANIEHLCLGDGNLIVCSSGYGEGCFRTYVGRNDAGEITRIVTDFQVLDLRFPSFGSL